MPTSTFQRIQRKPRNGRKLDHALAIEQAKRGLTNVEIARAQRVDQSTVWRFLQRAKPEIQALEAFKAHRSDYLATLQARCIDVQVRVLQTFTDDVIGALSPRDKSALLFATNAVSGTAYDKERLQRGLSTENHSIVRRLLEQQVKELYTPIIKAPGIASTPASQDASHTGD